MEKSVPLLDLKLQYAGLREEMQKSLNEVLESQYFIGGPAIAELEKIIAQYSGVDCAIGMSSGTDALIAALLALDITRSPCSNEPAPEVIVPSFTFFASAGSVWRSGARPVFADINEDTFNVSVESIESKITERTKAIMPVHLYGQCADMESIMTLAKKHNLAVIEDACQSIGAQRNGKRAGSFGDAGCFSFFPTKNLGGVGDGGMSICSDKSLGDKMRQVRNHGMEPRYYHKFVGGNFRLDTIQAAALIIKTKHLEKWHSMRQRNAEFYLNALKDVNEILLPKTDKGNVHIYNQFVIRTPKRNECISFLKERGITCEIYYPMPLHLQECFVSLGYKQGDFPVSEKIAQDCLALPIFPELNEGQLQYVVNSLKDFLAK